MFLGVSNYSLWAMKKTNFCNLLFLVFLRVLCNSNDYNYDNYKYDDYNYLENYDYDYQRPEDYTDDYSSQGLNDYYDQNLLRPPNPPPLPSWGFYPKRLVPLVPPAGF